MSNQPKPQAVQVHRLSESAYQDLAKKLPKPLVSNDTSAHHAGYLLGIQYVMQILREGYVVSTG